MSSKKIIKGLALVAFSASFTLSTIQSAYARPGTLATAPLFLSSIVEPNVFLTMDDSGSMDWTPMQSAASGVGGQSNGLPVIDGRQRAYLTTTFNNLYNPGRCYFVVPPFTNGVIPSWDSSWVVRNHLSNRTYYNPNITYEPWRGTKADGTPMYGQASVTAALEHPDGSEAVNLETTYTYTEPGWVGNTNCNTAPNQGATAAFYIPTYYAWPDINGDGVSDARDIGDGDNIVEATDLTTAEILAYEVRIPVSSTAEMQNFANWFQYYRSRMNAAKAVIGATVNNTDASRVGLRMFNAGHRMDVESMSNQANKRALLTELYTFVTGRNGTPARRSLRDTGRYFDAAYTTSGIPEPILGPLQGGECQQNFNILMSDGFWNGGTPSVGNTDDDNPANNPYDGNAAQSDNGGNYADAWSSTLADVAMLYYKNDLSPLADKVPTSLNSPLLPGDDGADHQHLVNFTIAFGLNGTLDPQVDDPLAVGFSWPAPVQNTPTTVDDMWHAAYNSRGRYLSAGNPGELLVSLNAAIARIAELTATAAAVSINSAQLNLGTVVFKAEFNTNRWQGDLKAFKIKVISDNGTPLDPTDDILDPLGTLNTTAEWSAGTILTARTNLAANRFVATYNASTGMGIPFRWTNLSATQKLDLSISPTGALDANGPARTDYLRGDRSLEGVSLRGRLSLLGDLVNSGPVYVGEPGLNWPDRAPFPTAPGKRYSDFKNGPTKSRPGVVYTAANDGMLHGFEESNGNEVMAYIPNSLFSLVPGEGMHYLTDPNYGHRYTNDLTPTLSDVYADLGNGLQWQTILINGLRGGGRGIYALNVNDPADFKDTSTDKVVLWEFSAADALGANLGHTFSKPQIAMDNNGRWVAIFGNGYNDLGDGKAKLYILDIVGGLDGWDASDVTEIDTGIGSTGDRNGLSTPRLADLNGDGTVDRAYAGDLFGNMWSFDLSGTTRAIDRKLFTTVGGEPITTQPVLAKHPTISLSGSNAPNVMVYFGSGQYLTNADKTDATLNHFYGVWDNGNGFGLTNLVKQVYQPGFTDSNGDSVRVLSNNVVNYGGGEFGWYFELDEAREKNIFRAVLRGGIVFFTTFIPNDDPCGSGGDSWLFSVDMINGGSPSKPPTDTNGDGVVDANDRVKNGSLDGVMAANKDKGVKTTPTISENLAFDPEPLVLEDLKDLPTGRFSWQELIQ